MSGFSVPDESLRSLVTDHVAAVKGSGQGAPAYAKVSTLPLRVAGADGELTEPSLKVVSSGTNLVPEAPFVPVRIDPSATARVWLGDDLSFVPVTSAGSSGAMNLGGGALFARTQLDTDYLVKPMPFGVEAFWQLRSPRSPESLDMKLSLPPGASLRGSDTLAGAVEVVQGDSPRVTVMPPSARDADGYPVPVSMSVQGDILTVSVEHRSTTARYPILVDPYYARHGVYNQTDQNTPFNGWGHFGPSNFSYTQEGAPPIGIYAGSSGNSGPTFAAHSITAPGSAEIFRADLASVSYQMSANTPVWLYSWISANDAGANPAWTFNGYDRNQTRREMPMYYQSNLSNQPVALCADNYSNGQDTAGSQWCKEGGGAPGNRFDIGLYTAGTWTSPKAAFENLYGSALSITDNGVPAASLSNVYSDWSQNVSPVTVSASQNGLGVGMLRVMEGETTLAAADTCSESEGASLPPCPQNPSRSISLPTLSEGQHSISSEAESVTGVLGRSGSLTVKIDRTPPQMPSIADLQVQSASPITVSVSDARSGVGSLDVTMTAPNGSTRTLISGSSCTPVGSGCSVSPSFTLPLDEFGYGRYTVSYRATDRANPINRSADNYWVDYYRPPGKPRNVSATAIGSGTVRLNWDEPVDAGGKPVSSYLIQVFKGGTKIDERIVDSSNRQTEFSGLQVGAGHTFRVSATSEIGTGAFEESASVVPYTAPGPVSALGAAAGCGEATASWNAPAADGGSPITAYRVSWFTSGGQKIDFREVPAVPRSYTARPLANGVGYYFEVQARNADGLGGPQQSSTVTPTCPPGVPTNVNADPGYKQASVSWQPPADDGGFPITGYQVYTYLASDDTQVGPPVSYLSTRRTHTSTNLADGVAYYFKVGAINALGYGNFARSSNVTTWRLASAPPGVATTAGCRSATVSWGVPADSGGAPVFSYRVTWYTSAGFKVDSQDVPITPRTRTVSDLTNGADYYFTVQAVTAAGAGTASQSNVVRPMCAPSASTNLAVIAGNGQATVAWDPPTDDGGTPLTGYRVYTYAVGASDPVAGPHSWGTGQREHTTTGLANGTAYYFKVEAINAVGSGPAARSADVTPRRAPDAPRNVAAQGGDSRATVTWDAPSYDGGAPIDQYIATAYKASDGSFVKAQSVSSGARTVTITDLPFDTYVFKVRARNAAGDGPEASSTPVALPDRTKPILRVTGSVRAARVADADRGIFAHAEDEQSGVSEIVLYVKSQIGTGPMAFVPDQAEPLGSEQVGQPQRCTMACSGSAGFNATFAFPSDKPAGRYQITVRARDIAGNVSDDRWVVAVVPTRTRERDRLGLEQWFDLDDTDAGGESTAYVNGQTGNLVWHLVPIVNPGRGLSTAVNLTYNSRDRGGLLGADLTRIPLLGSTSDDTAELGVDLAGLAYREAGVNFSLGIGGPSRVNEPLGGVVAAGAEERKLTAANTTWKVPDASITLTDADGTRHEFQRRYNSNQWTSPDGVDMRLEYVGPRSAGAVKAAGITDLSTDRSWELLRPDGIRHIYDSFGYQQATIDRNGNTLDYVYEAYSAVTGERCDQGDLVGTALATYGLCIPRLREVRQPTWEAAEPGSDSEAEDRRVTIDYEDPTNTSLGALFGSIGLAPETLLGVDVAAGDAPQIKTITDASGRTYTFDYYSDATRKGYLREFTESATSPQVGQTGRTTRFKYDEDLAGAAQPRMGDAQQLTAVIPVEAGGELPGTQFVYEPRSYPSDPARPPKPRRVERIIERDGTDKLFRYTGEPSTFTVLDHTLGKRYLSRVSLIDTGGRPTSVTESTVDLASPSAVPQPLSAQGQTRTDITWKDSENKPVSVIEGAGTPEQRTTTVSYLDRSAGAITSKVVEGQGESWSTSISYHGTGFIADVKEVVLPGGRKWEYGIDDRGNVTTTTDPNGVTVMTTYDADNGYVMSGQQDLMKKWTYFSDYDPTGQPRTVSLPDDGAAGEGDALTPSPRVWKYRYDSRGDVVKIIDPRNRTGDGEEDDSPFVTTLTYDSFARLVKERRPRNSRPDDEQAPGAGPEFVKVSRQYNRDGQLIYSEDAKGQPTRINRDAVSLPTEVVRPGSSDPETTRLVYDDAHRLIATASPNGSSAINPAAVRAEQTEACDGSALGSYVRAYLTRLCLDYRGQPMSRISYSTRSGDVGARVWTSAYDSLGRRVRANDPRRNSVGVNEAPMPAASRASALADAGQPRTRITYDALDRVREVRQASRDGDDQVRTMEYSPQGDLKSVTDRDPVAPDRKVTMGYDKAGRMTSRTDPLGRMTCILRRDDGLPTEITSPRGTQGDAACKTYSAYTTKISYDGIGDVVSRSIPYSPGQYGPNRDDIKNWVVTYKRDLVGNPIEIADAKANLVGDKSSAEYTARVAHNSFYDSGELRSTDRPATWRLDWDGDQANPEAGNRYTGADAADVQVATDGPIVSERQGSSANADQDDAPAKPESLGKTDFGESRVEPLPDGLPQAGKTILRYDPEMRLESIEDADGKKREIHYDPAGRVDHKVWPLDTRSIRHDFSYDADGNLTRVLEDLDERRVKTEFGYDGYDRRISETTEGASASLTDVSVASEPTLFGYDVNDNLVSRTTPRGPGYQFDYHYDSLDQLTSESNPAGQTWEYEYDAFGEPVKEIAPHSFYTNADLYTSSFDYDDAGQLIGVERKVDQPDDEPDHTLDWTFDYDRDGNRSSTEQPGSPARTKIEVEHDGRGLPWRTTVSGGSDNGAVKRTTITEYDAAGALRRTVNPLGLGEDRLPIGFDDGTDSLVNLERASRDATVRRRQGDDLLVEERMPWRGASDTHYTRIWHRDDSKQKWITAIELAKPVGSSNAFRAAYEYNDAGWITQRTDQYRPSAESDPKPLFTYGYDRYGHQVTWRSRHARVDDTGREMRWAFWQNGLLKQRTAVKTINDSGDEDPNTTSRTYQYGYNPNRSLVEVLDTDVSNAPGKQQRLTKFGRDAAERETTVNETWPTGVDSQSIYDQSTGDLLNRRTDGSLNDDGAYGGDNARLTSFRYDSMGRELWMKVKPARGEDRITKTRWYDGSSVDERTKSNGTRDVWKWNALGDKTRHERYRVGQPTAGDPQSYEYDGNGNRTKDERGTHVYNARDQLVQWIRPPDGGGRTDRPGWITDYTLAGDGQILQKNERAPGQTTGIRTTFNYQGERLENAITTDTTQPASVSTKYTYRYDDAGNVQRVYRQIDTTLPLPVETAGKTALSPAECKQSDTTATTQTTRYCYDEFNRQIFATGNGMTDPAEISYDGLDRRDTKRTKDLASSDTEVRDYSYLGTSELVTREKVTTSGTAPAVKHRYYDYDSRGDRQGVQFDDTATTTRYKVYAKDANGSVTGLEAQDGTIAAADEYNYDPYGERDFNSAASGMTRAPTPPGDPEEGLSEDAKANPFRYEGFYYDSGVKTYDMHARAYRPEMGRFLSRDQYASAIGDVALAADPLTQNRYAFGGGNPVTNVEFDGHRDPKVRITLPAYRGPEKRKTSTPSLPSGPSSSGCAGPCGTEGPRSAVPSHEAPEPVPFAVVNHPSGSVARGGGNSIFWDAAIAPFEAARWLVEGTVDAAKDTAEYAGDCGPIPTLVQGKAPSLDCLSKGPEAAIQAASLWPGAKGVTTAGKSALTGGKAILGRIFPRAAKTEAGGYSRLRAMLRDERGGYDPSIKLGTGGTQTTSTTLGRGRGYRIDVENPAPGVRPGQLHLQDSAGGKYLYDFEAEEFSGLPRSLAKQIAGDPTVARSIAKGRTYLGLDR